MMREVYGEDGYDLSSYRVLKKSNIGQILNNDIVKRVMDCLTDLDHDRVLTLTENSYVGLVIHISIAINRIRKNEVMEYDVNWKQDISRDEDYELAEKIVQKLEQEFQIDIPRVEVSYICLHLKGAKHEKIQWSEDAQMQLEHKKLQQLVNEMIDAYDKKQAYLLKQDDGFIQGLLAHLQPTLIRLVYGMSIQNPVLEDIKVTYPEMYRRCEDVAAVLEGYTGKKVPEQEIGFLTVHFGAAMVRLEGRKEKIDRKSAV